MSDVPREASRFTGWIGLCLCGATALVSVTLLASPVRAQGMPPADDGSIYTLRVENDTFANTDRYYSAGDQIGWTGPTGYLPDFIARAGHAAFGDGQQRISIDISQSLFTPVNTQISPPDPTDRPYAATLVVTGQLIQDDEISRTKIGTQLGVLGPDAGGQLVQNAFHTIIGDAQNKGWAYQLDNRPIVNLFIDRTYRVPLLNLPVDVPYVASSGLAIDMLPDITGFVGTQRVYGEAGATFRIGQGLDTDYGVARILPGMTGGDAYNQNPGLTWYAFGGVDGQAVAYDTLLDGNSFTSQGPHVNPKPFVAEFEAGLAIILHGVKISYTQVWQTHEFDTQQGGMFEFGSLAVSARF
jgi:lipid A 3-O-deacylase